MEERSVDGNAPNELPFTAQPQAPAVVFCAKRSGQPDEANETAREFRPLMNANERS
jgi:hypothetical protein